MSVDAAPKLIFAIGSIGPSHRSNVDFATMQQVVNDLDDCFVATEPADIVPRQCVDGRPRSDNTCAPAPNAAGGTFSAVVGDALTTNHFRADKTANAAMHARQIYAFLTERGYAVGGHDADHASGNDCGCGAEDKLSAMLEFIRDHGADIRIFLKDLVAVSDQTHELIVGNASQLLQSGYVCSGKELRQAFVDIAGAESVETLAGPHNELVLIVNTQPDTTLDRARLRTKFGDAYQAFNVDIPALRKAAEITSITPLERDQKLAAMLYYNVAVAAVLADSSMPVIVR